MKAKGLEGNLTRQQWLELCGIEYTLTMYPKYYSEGEYPQAVSRLQELRELRFTTTTP